MTHIEQLIQDMCPNGVEWKTLGEVATLSRGKVYSKEYLRDNAGEYPVYSSQTANNGELGRISTYDYDGKYLTWTTDGAYAGTVFRREGRFSITNVCGLISNVDKALSIDFLYYWLNKVAKGYVYQGMGNPKLMSNVMETIEIPLPPLEIQKKIVECLDKFSALAAELQMRRKQYEHYRTQLLTPHSESISADKSDDCNWVSTSIGNICPILRGKRLTKSELSEDEKYPVFHGGIEPLGYYKEHNREANTVMIINVGASAGTVGYCDQDFWSSDGCFCLGKSDRVIPKFLYYLLQTREPELKSRVRYAGIPTLDGDVIKRLQVSIPPLKEQARIVEILDKFDKLITSMEEGIPAEQIAQQKRYEYYREKLLSFEKKV